MEHEMALAGLEDIDLTEAIPADIKIRENQSLLRRMQTLKTQMIAKRQSGLIPKYSITTDEEDYYEEGVDIDVESRPATPDISSTSGFDLESLAQKGKKKKKGSKFRQKLKNVRDSQQMPHRLQ